MIKVSIPGRGDLELHHLVLDMNGTLTTDGLLPEGVAPLIEQLMGQLHVPNRGYVRNRGTGSQELGIKMFTCSDHERADKEFRCP